MTLDVAPMADGYSPAGFLSQPIVGPGDLTTGGGPSVGFGGVSQYKPGEPTIVRSMFGDESYLPLAQPHPTFVEIRRSPTHVTIALSGSAEILFGEDNLGHKFMQTDIPDHLRPMAASNGGTLNRGHGKTGYGRVGTMVQAGVAIKIPDGVSPEAFEQSILQALKDHGLNIKEQRGPGIGSKFYAAAVPAENMPKLAEMAGGLLNQEKMANIKNSAINSNAPSTYRRMTGKELFGVVDSMVGDKPLPDLRQVFPQDVVRQYQPKVRAAPSLPGTPSPTAKPAAPPAPPKPAVPATATVPSPVPAKGPPTTVAAPAPSIPAVTTTPSAPVKPPSSVVSQPGSEQQIDALKPVVETLTAAIQPKLGEFVRGGKSSDAATANRVNGELFRMQKGLEVGVPPDAGRLQMIVAQVKGIAPGLDADQLTTQIKSASQPPAPAVATRPAPPAPSRPPAPATVASPPATPAVTPAVPPTATNLDAIPFDSVRTALNATNANAPEQTVRQNFAKAYNEAIANAPDDLRQLVERSGPVTKSLFVETYRAALRTPDGTYATPDAKQPELKGNRSQPGVAPNCDFGYALGQHGYTTPRIS
jgi:hypothetical protein